MSDISVHARIFVAMLRRRILFALATSKAFERVAPKRRAWRSARRYVAGETLEDAVATVRRLHAAGFESSVDLFGERGRREDADRVAREYERLCAALSGEPGAWISIDFSHVAFDVDVLDRIAAAVPEGRRLQVGAEEAAVTDRVLDAVIAVAGRGRPVEATLQANLKRSPEDAERLTHAGVPIRLVKGAYVEQDAHPWGPATDHAYAELAHRLPDAALATHDEALLADLPHPRVEHLLGLAPRTPRPNRSTRIYVPYGPDWFRYFMRRRAESQGA
jgi:proline dehydrogenase